MAEPTETERVRKIRRAAVAFANDYGPLAAANSGEVEAQHYVAQKLFNACKAQGLKIIINPDAE